MTRWELIVAFRELAKLLFLEDKMDQKELILRVKQIVFDVVTEADPEMPVKFTATEK